MSPHLPSLRVAILDGDKAFLPGLINRLRAAGWQYELRAGPIRPDQIAALKLNALLIDPGVLGPSWWSYLEEICPAIPGLSVIVCSEGSTVAQRVRALRLGVDDWITKPSHPDEVMARIGAVVRRHRRGRVTAEAGPVVAGEIEIRADQFQAYSCGESLELTRREFEVLGLLAGAQGQVIEREEIYHRVWGYAMAHGDRSVDVFVRKLRQKLQRFSGGWSYIHTHFGIGYRFEPEPVGGVDTGATSSSPSDRKASNDVDPPTPSAPEAVSQPFHQPVTAR
jgi:DNA-binding response OmpR family regulator